MNEIDFKYLIEQNFIELKRLKKTVSQLNSSIDIVKNNLKEIETKSYTATALLP